MVLAEDLRQAVLQAALQGKLTEQLETDSDVEALLNKIQLERKRLVLEKKIKKVSIKPIKHGSVPYDIPSTWRWQRIGSFEEINLGFTYRPQYVNEGVYFLSVKDISSGKIDFSNAKRVSQETYDKASYGSKPMKGDILFGRVCTMGKPQIIESDIPFCIFVSLGFFREHTNLMNKEYISYWMQSPLFYEQVNENVKGLAQKNLNTGWLKDFFVPIPPIEEQQRIVDKINEIMPKIDEYEKIEKELETLKKEFPTNMKDALLQAAMQGKLTEQLESDSSVDELLASIQKEKEELIAQKKIKKEKPLPDIKEEEIPFDIPENWKWMRWGNLAYSIQYGYNAPAQEAGKIKMVRISDIQDNSVNWDSVPYCDIPDEEIETYLLKENDILFARTGGTVGKSFLVNSVPEDAIYAGYLIRTRYNNQLVPRYLKLFMESQLYWIQLQNGKTQGCQPNCNGQTLSKMMIPLPPIEEQQRIVERLDALLPLCEDLKEE